MIRSCMLAVTVLILVAFAGGSALAAPSKTLDNLMAAYNGESNAKAKYAEFAKKAEQEGEIYERDKMYPEFIAEAKASGNKEALRAFNFAVSAEAEHAKFYSEAGANLQALSLIHISEP